MRGSSTSVVRMAVFTKFFPKSHGGCFVKICSKLFNIKKNTTIFTLKFRLMCSVFPCMFKADIFKNIF